MKVIMHNKPITAEEITTADIMIELNDYLEKIKHINGQTRAVFNERINQLKDTL